MEVDSNVGSRRLALIKAVRSLDEDGSITLPEKIRTLWVLLSATKSTRLHGVEENILRWLFKIMSGKTEDAEQVRRYPLTWSLLGHVFPKIPPQTLGRSLASLRFVSILHQTINDITTARKPSPVSSTQTNGITSDNPKKRKRDDRFPSDIEELRTPQGCIKSATELFRALGSLLDQGARLTGPSTSERKVGAEHIKSLFSSSNEETRDIAAGLLLTCDRSLGVLEHGLSGDQESWIGIITILWNLRLHNKDDSLEFARHIYVPICSILTRLRGLAGVTSVTVTGEEARRLWIRQLERFLNAYFVRPARHTFATDENVEVIEIALDLAKRNLGGSAIVTWDIAARTPRDSSNPKSKAEHTLWAQNVFTILLKAIQSLDPLVRNQIIIQLLDTAIQANSVPNTTALRTVCREHALRTDKTDWKLISKALACDADVFLTDDSLIEGVFNRISSISSHDLITREIVVKEVILPLEDAFAKARNFSGFIQKWYECLSESAADSLGQSIWVDAEIRQHLARILQSTLTSTQLLRVLERLDSSDAPNGALLVVLDGISAGITEEDFTRSVDSKIFSALFEDKNYKDIPSSILSLRWRIAGRMASWETSEEVDRLWVELKSILKRILKKGILSDPETFEAFGYSYNVWLANYPGGKHYADLAKLTSSFLERVVSEMKTNIDSSVSRPYVDYAFRFLPRLADIPKGETTDLRDLIVDMFWQTEQHFIIDKDTLLSDALRPLLHNFDCEDDEALIESLISKPLDSLDDTENQSGWTQPRGLSMLSILLDFPREALTKGRRKRIMSSWKNWRSKIANRASQDSLFAVTVLRLLVKVMQQPTFYEDMEFDDLVYISSNMWQDDKNVVALIEKLTDLTLRQMVTNTDGTSLAYLAEASNFVKSLDPKASKDTASQILLVKSIVSTLHNSSNKSYISSINVDEIIRKLERQVQNSLTRFASKNKQTDLVAEDESTILSLSITLSGAACVADAYDERRIELTDKTIHQLESMSTSYVSKKAHIGWKLRAFLFRNHPDRYDSLGLFTQLEQASTTVDEDVVYDLVDAFVKNRGQPVRDRLLGELVGSGKLASGAIGPLLAVRRLVELRHGHATSSSSAETQDTIDLGVVHERLASLLSQAESLQHFKQLSEILLLLLDRHASAMAQFNIEATLSSVVHVCSQAGPKIQDHKAAGEIYDKLYRLVALILKRHRLRLTGHFPILLGALRALLATLLADPGIDKADATFSQTRPPWLGSHLQSRHAERFTRLLTLICEPSAASVARTRSNELDSATDIAKRTAGQDMFTILELYIKLQLEVNVPRDIRKALKPGVYSLLDITPQGCRRVLNESLDANGRAVFREMFANYKKFGKWTGV
ncbi:Urb2/Npa2 family-domain-containing protein [Daldinia decipiens]|uniref:Urb2/Npa2 family-domain-containing protein n=1 Tax=Daldinia decipiens TaxID=326647 RepID=UPI0020C22324|nr:Urb2/Npa2 family-domain-containing protein [Daldinia decipiens]KAI1659654.1 Urb2/Npa2 family-domain-containing protein [Daldinia decipiens]